MLVLLVLLSSRLVEGQSVLQVISKNIEKTLPYKSGYELSIDGEKADVTVQAGNTSVIKVSVEIVAKHIDLTTARLDLEQVQFDAELQGRKVVLRNFIKPYPNGKKPASSIKTKYLIVVPSDCAVQLKNNFGKTNVSNLYNFLQMYTEFSQVGLNNIKGTVSVDSKFGDIYAKNIDGDVKINTRRSNITMSDLRGNYQIQMSYGKANISSNLEPINLNIQGDHADILFLPFNKPYSYDLNTKSGLIDLPQNLAFNISDAGQNVKSAYLRPQGQIRGVVTIKMNFGNIKVVN
jgi:phage-related protein